jgi:hypothetical protein
MGDLRLLYPKRYKYFIDFVKARLKYKLKAKMTIEKRSVVPIDALCVCQNLPGE